MKHGLSTIRRLALGGVVSVFALAACVQVSAAKNLSYATLAADVYSPMQLDSWFMQEVTKRTEGRLTFSTFYNGTLLGAPDIMSGTGAGAADLGSIFPLSYNSSEYPISGVMMPLLTANPYAMMDAFMVIYNSNGRLREEYESRNLRVLYGGGYAENTLWTRMPIKTAADLDGKRLRAVGPIGEVYHLMGADVVALPWSESVEGVQRGVVDGMTTSPIDSSISAGLHDLLGNVTNAGELGPTGVQLTFINLDVWNALSPEDQKIIEEVASETTAKYRDILEPRIENAVSVIQTKIDAGQVEFSYFNDEQNLEFVEKAGKPLIDAWLAEMEKQGIDGQALLDEFNAAIESAEKAYPYETGIARLAKQN